MIQGFIEVIRPFQVRGWAYDTDLPDVPLEVVLSVAGEGVATSSATLLRDDLLQSGVGNGRHGFVLNVDRRLPTRNLDEIRVECRSPGGDGVSLPRIAGCVTEEESANLHDAGPSETSPIDGYFDILSPLDVAGWAYNKLRPEDHLSVEVLCDGRLVGSAIAREFRADLVPALTGSGDHGFALKTTDALHGTIDVVARAADGAVGRLKPVAQARPATAQPAERFEPRVVFRGDADDHAHHPVFILGAARSGTSAIAQALVAATRYVGYEEGHLLDLISPLMQLIRQHYEDQSDEWKERSNTMIAAVASEFLEAGVRHAFVELARQLFPKGWWIDKTPRPGMITAAPLLKRIWPEARFVFMKRRGLENVVSRMAKFPTVSFEKHCRDWTQTMRAWEAVRGSLKGSAMEIDQLYLARRPREAAAVLGPFLMLQPNEILALGQALATDRPERTAERFASVISIDQLGWPHEQRETFERLCGPTMEKYGYDLAGEYYRNESKTNAIMRL